MRLNCLARAGARACGASRAPEFVGSVVRLRSGASRTGEREETRRFAQWLGSLDVVPTIAALHERADEIVRQVLSENEHRWVSLSDADRERVEVLARAVASRLLHEPTLRLKGSTGDESYAYLQALRELFGIEAAGSAAPDAPAAEVTSLDSRRRRRAR